MIDVNNTTGLTLICQCIENAAGIGSVHLRIIAVGQLIGIAERNILCEWNGTRLVRFLHLSVFPCIRCERPLRAAIRCQPWGIAP